MQDGFPTALLALVRCPRDCGELRSDAEDGPAFVEQSTARCVGCGRTYPIRDGVLSLLEPEQLHAESAFELRVRDERNELVLSGARPEWASAFADATEVAPTLAAVDPGGSDVVCEIGCGPGRYSIDLAKRTHAVLAVDFSRPGLLVVRRKLAARASVALVQADVTRPFAAPARFDRVLSTLHSNLPDAAGRAACLREVASMLKRSGRAVISMHHYALRDALARNPASGRYPDSGIYRCYMTTRQSRREARDYFERLRHVYINAPIPILPSATLSRVAARVPLIRAALAQLFLAIGEGPLAGDGHRS